MTLFNKDGSIYTLPKPNPIMNNQNLWSDSIELHNMKWNSEKAEDKTTVNPVQSDFSISDTFLSSLEETKPKASEQKEPERKTVVVKDNTKIIEKQNDIQKVYIHCLPAIIRDRVDSLYGDSYKTIEYKDPTSFEGVIIDQQDLTIQIWTDIQVEKGSILYPKTNTKNWWRIQSIESKMGGYLLNGIISDYQPSFLG